MTSQPSYAYVIAIFLGLLAAAAPAALPLESPSFTILLLISTAIFGVTGLLLVTIGVISSRQFETFFGDDSPFLASGLLGACLGGAIGARLRGAGQDSD